MMAIVVNCVAILLDAEGLCNFLGAGACLEKMLGNLGALLCGESGDGSKNPAQGYGDVVNVVHQANSFSGERHGIPRELCI